MSFNKVMSKISEALRGGKGDDVPDKEFDKKELKKGTKHEKEHTKNKAIAKEIAKDHIVEDKKYYEHLEKVEKMAFAQGFEKVALDLKTVTKAVGFGGEKVRQAAKTVAAVPKRIAEKGAVGKIEGARLANNKTTPVGSGAYNAQARKMQAQGKAPSFSEAQKMQSNVEGKTLERKSRMDKYKKDKANSEKGSFASRHPIATAGMAYMGARYALGGGDQQQQKPPPQISYY